MEQGAGGCKTCRCCTRAYSVACAVLHGLERLDGVTVTFAKDAVQDVVRTLNSLSAMSAMSAMLR